MNRSFKDNFRENFSKNEIGSNNRINLRDPHFASSPAVTMLVGFALVVVLAIIVTLVVTAPLWALIGLYVLACAGLVAVLIWIVCFVVERVVKTKAACTYYSGQPIRNRIIDVDGVPVLYDPILDELTPVVIRDVKQDFHYDQPDAGMVVPADNAPQDTDFLRVLKGGRLRDENEA